MKEPDPHEARAWIAAREGISLMTSDDTAILRRALACFDESIALREILLTGEPEDAHWRRYNLAGSWINKGDVLSKLAPRPSADDEAIRAYDRALEVLEALPDSGDPRFGRRHALAWLKRGERLVNARSLAAARDSAARAIDLIGRAERDAIEDALLSLKARLIAGALAADASDSIGEGRGLETASTGDAAEHALALAVHWRADCRVGLFAREFFRLGAEAYAWRQPQFLGEYLREWQPFVAEAAGAASADAIAQAARAFAFSGVANRALATLDQTQLGRTLATLRDLRAEKASEGDFGLGA